MAPGAVSTTASTPEFGAADLRGLTLAVLQGRLTTPDRLDHELLAGGTAGVAALRAGVVAYRSGAWSPPEAILVDAVARRPDLPPMLANPTLRTPDDVLIGVPDGFFPEVGVVVQVHSKEHHTGLDAAGAGRWAATVEHDHDFQRHGLAVVGVTPETLRDSLEHFLDSLAAIIARRRNIPVPEVVGES